MNITRLCIVLVSIPVLAAATNTRAWAWGEEGHRTVARIAEKHLSAKARAGITDLIGNRSISDKNVALWADSIKHSSFYNNKFPKNATWHYVDLPIGEQPPSIADFCAGHNCVVEAVKRFQNELKDPEKSELQRKEALFFLVHFLGDAHQPLHCAALNDDKGGNKRNVLIPGDEDGEFHRANLHQIWDTDLVQAAMDELTINDFATRLNSHITGAQRTEWNKGDIAAWALESWKVARDNAYQGITGNAGIDGPPIKLSKDYVAANKLVVEQQIEKAGIRLAKVLNDAFD